MKYVLFFALVVPLVCVSGFGFLGALTADGHHHTPGCPYAPGTYAVCPMNTLEHLLAWQKTFSRTALPTIAIFVSCLVCAWIYVLTKPHTMRGCYFYARLATQRLRCFFHETQHLFSSGVLHPKAP